MKYIAITILIVCLFITFPAKAETSVIIPVKTHIINLALMPVNEALIFCNQRHMDCPAIRDKAAKAIKDKILDNENFNIKEEHS